MTRLLLALCALAFGQAAAANYCAVPSRAGIVSGLSGIVNTYYPATASAGVGATSITLGTAQGAASPIAAGDLLLVIQMQDATIDTTNSAAYGTATINNSGRYEFVRAANGVALTGGTLTLVGGGGGGLANAYTNAGFNTVGQRRFQVIRVPQYADLTLGGTVTGADWNGTSGGVVVLDIAGTLNLNGGTISAAALGFRGGGGRHLAGGTGLNTDYRTLATNAANAGKGEGIAGTPRYLNDNNVLLDTGVEGYANGSYGRGAPATGGGGGTDGAPLANDQNTGGGGGAGYGAGGLGGHAWCGTAPTACPQTGGIGGRAVTSLGVDRLIMGGGGGAGTNNNGTGTPASGLASSGVDGGGIVIVRADKLRGSGTINVGGASANNSVLNDGSGGGGAGGSALISALDATGASVTVNASGGNGGTNTGGGAAHGPGGGGGGGFVASSVTVSATVTGGTAGTTANGGTFGASYGAQGGNGGGGATIITSAVPGMSSGAECTPVISKAFSVSPIGIGQTSRLSVTVQNRNPTLAMTAVAFTDTYPTSIANAAVPNPTTACGGSVAAAANGPSLALSGASVAAASTCTVAADVTGKSAGDAVNTIPAGGLTVAYATQTVASLSSATATLKVLAPLTATKAGEVYWDPINLFTNPKNIPGAIVTYTITVANPSGQPTDTNSVVLSDAIPANTRMMVRDFGVAGRGPIAFVDGASPSGLTYSYVALPSTTDDLEFTTAAAPAASDWGYVPTPNVDGIDPAVTFFRVRLKNHLVTNGSFSIRFRALVQ
ncbi:DUF7933 domain-containing protein [Sphingomonas glaciei]|uniref:DUF7933 domain-containing protein n=1 Tax=Sphingomonas glaciei TaxID=2938948 RepID=A0ABY5N1I4_9SPHN|nr:hypothetical protein [Sphingomonas glaciei]UUR08446.1 hypothetical protein M1K48_02015 [Sphingomonas glaciei]